MIASLLLLTALPIAVEPVKARGGSPLLVIVAASVSLHDIKLSLLRRAFEGLALDIEGKRIIPINHPNDTPTRSAFDRAVLGLEPQAVGQFWVDRRIRDEASPPRSVRSEELALRVVASLPGAITYLSPELLNPSVRVLTVDGRALGQPGYVLSP
jgi:hypothetical protein